MYNLKKKVGSLLLAFLLIAGLFTSIPAFAADSFDVIFDVVTDEDSTTLPGEAKVKVSITGMNAQVNTIQANVTFSGELEYKSIDYLQGAVDLPSKYQTATEASTANATNELQAAIFSLDEPITFSGKTELFIITFEGEVGDSVTLTLDKDNTFVKIGNDKLYAKENVVSEAAIATADANEAANAVVKIVMDKVSDFAVSADQPITLTITNERTKKSVSAVLSNNDRTGVIPITFTIENTVLANDTYTVELSGNGYKTYKQTGVDFENELEITNAEFVPGDINKDNKIDSADKTLYEQIIAENEYNAAADFNHDGYVDERDNIFDDTESGNPEPDDSKPGDTSSEATKPEKPEKPDVDGGNKKITVSWKAPKDGGSPITGYIIKYGTSKTNLNKTVEITDEEETSITISDLSADKTYYVQIAATNKIGTGEYSDIASASTNEESSGGGGGGGGGGGSSGGSSGGSGFGGGFVPGEASGSVAPSANGEVFTDLENHIWAKDSVYTLKNKGIISGVSATEFAPASNIKRGDFILILTRMLSVADEFTENFADVPADSYYYNAIGSARAAGIAQGSGENFMPENTITRQDLITLSYRAFLAKGYITETDDMTSLDAFGDKSNISDYALAPMASMVKSGIIQGSDGNVNPLGNATRAEVAVMCARLLALMN